ncbi:hypothetical protein ACQ4PT_039025 [Festuca glaucescens]
MAIKAAAGDSREHHRSPFKEHLIIVAGLLQQGPCGDGAFASKFLAIGAHRSIQTSNLTAIRPFAAAGSKAPARAALLVRQELQEFAREAKAELWVPPFKVIVAQGLTGSFPWSGLSFTAMWLELVGFSHGETAALITLFQVAASLGSLFGGRIGDVITGRLKNSPILVEIVPLRSRTTVFALDLNLSPPHDMAGRGRGGPESPIRCRNFAVVVGDG